MAVWSSRAANGVQAVGRERAMPQPLSLDDLVAPVSDLGKGFPDVISSWRWLVPETASPLLLAALGDVFLELQQQVHFLDTEAGSLVKVADSRKEWKEAMQSPERLTEWLQPDRVSRLREHGLGLGPGEVYSPLVPAVLGGSRGPENRTNAPWRNHLNVLGQVHDQVRRLPDGSRIDRTTFEPV